MLNQHLLVNFQEDSFNTEFFKVEKLKKTNPRAAKSPDFVVLFLDLKLPVVPQNDYRAVTRPSDCSDILCWSVSGSKDIAESAAACRGPKRIMNYEL